MKTHGDRSPAEMDPTAHDTASTTQGGRHEPSDRYYARTGDANMFRGAQACWVIPVQLPCTAAAPPHSALTQPHTCPDRSHSVSCKGIGFPVPMPDELMNEATTTTHAATQPQKHRIPSAQLPHLRASHPTTPCTAPPPPLPHHVASSRRSTGTPPCVRCASHAGRVWSSWPRLFRKGFRGVGFTPDCEPIEYNRWVSPLALSCAPLALSCAPQCPPAWQEWVVQAAQPPRQHQHPAKQT